jgi:hypothetical protein
MWGDEPKEAKELVRCGTGSCDLSRIREQEIAGRVGSAAKMPSSFSLRVYYNIRQGYTKHGCIRIGFSKLNPTNV